MPRSALPYIFTNNELNTARKVLAKSFIFWIACVSFPLAVMLLFLTIVYSVIFKHTPHLSPVTLQSQVVMLLL